jgi:hypothetical protein
MIAVTVRVNNHCPAFLKLVKNGVSMIIHIYAKVSPSLKLIKAIPLWKHNEAD